MAGAALALSACGGGTDKAGEAGAEGGTLSYWSMWKVGEPQQLVIEKAIADFEEETGATVKVQWQGRSNVQKLVPALNTNNVPDIVDGPYAKLAPVLGNTGEALPLDVAYASEVEGTKVSDLIPEKYLKVSNISDKDGKPWMLPYSLSSDGIWYDAAKHPESKHSNPEFVTHSHDVARPMSFRLRTFVVRHGAELTQRDIQRVLLHLGSHADIFHADQWHVRWQ